MASYIVTVEPDHDSNPPWENSDCHGSVRVSRSRDKAPGERPLHSDRGQYWFYDWQGASKTALVDKWGGPDAVQRDFDYLRQYLAGYWSYCGITVTHPCGETTSLWGIEDNNPDYLKTVELELIEELEYPRRKAWRAALARARELKALHFHASSMGA